MPTFPSCDRSTLLGGAGVKFTARAGAEASEDRARRYERGESERRPRASWRRRKGIRMAREVAAAGLNRQLTVPGCDGVHCRRGQLCSSRQLRAGRSSHTGGQEGWGRMRKEGITHTRNPLSRHRRVFSAEKEIEGESASDVRVRGAKATSR